MEVLFIHVVVNYIPSFFPIYSHTVLNSLFLFIPNFDIMSFHVHVGE
jgi:hypothetical protein